MNLNDAQNHVGEHMNGILDAFIGDPKITVIVRQPGKPDQDFVMTNDDLEGAKETVQRRIDLGHQG